MTSQRLKSLKTLLFGAVIFAALVVFDYKCPIRALFGIACPGCGMMRAWLCVLKLDFKSAFYYHPLFFTAPLIPLLFTGCFKLGKKAEKILALLIGLAFLAVYLFRISRHFPDVL